MPSDCGAACVSSLSEVGHTSDSRKNAPFYSEHNPGPDVLAEAETLEQATRIYAGKRESEESQYSNTLHSTAKGNYRQTLEADRHLRRVYDNPTVALLTLCTDPVAGGEWVSPLDLTEAVGNVLSNVLARLRQLLSDYSWEYVAVRGASGRGVSHWHVVIWVDGNPSPDTFAPAVESFINNCDIKKPKQNPLDEAVKVNTTPSSDLKSIGKVDRHRGEVSQIARYVATQIPHVAGIEAMSEAEAMQGALEWAADSRGYRCSKGVPQVDLPDGEATHGHTDCDSGIHRTGAKTSERGTAGHSTKMNVVQPQLGQSSWVFGSGFSPPVPYVTKPQSSHSTNSVTTGDSDSSGISLTSSAKDTAGEGGSGPHNPPLRTGKPTVAGKSPAKARPVPKVHVSYLKTGKLVNILANFLRATALLPRPSGSLRQKNQPSEIAFDGSTTSPASGSTPTLSQRSYNGHASGPSRQAGLRAVQYSRPN